MKYVNALLVLVFLGMHCFGQNRKYFLNAENEVCDSVNAFSYMIVFEKKASDTVFKMNQYSGKNILLTTASFKNEDLSIPHGKFEYFKAIKENQIETNSSADTVNFIPLGSYLELSGNYILGEKNGVWTEYTIDGRVKKIETYRNGILDGKYVDYNATGSIFVSGEYVNGFREGKWTVFGGRQDDMYEHGRVVKVIKNKKVIEEFEKKRKEEELLNKEINKYDMPPKEPAGFHKELSKFIWDANSNNVKLETAVVMFMVKEDGTISEPSITGISDHSLMAKIKAYFKQSSGWKAGTTGKDKKPRLAMFRYRLDYL